MSKYLKRVLQDLDTRIKYNFKLPNSLELIRCLQCLNSLEKESIGSFMLNRQWNVGSANTMKILQDANILTMSDYIVKNEQPVSIEFILEDLLIFEHTLLANLLLNINCDNPHSTKIVEHLSEAFRNVLTDLFIRPDVLTVNYLGILKNLLPDKVMIETRSLHLFIFLQLESHSIHETINQQSIWNQEYSEKGPQTMLIALINEVVSVDKATVLEKLFGYVLTQDFSGWKWYLQLLGQAIRNIDKELIVNVKGFLKKMFKEFLTKRCEIYFYVMMITVRQICHLESNLLYGSYYNWFKQIIGEMQYTMNADEFKYTMSILGKMLKLENDDEIISVHANTAISAPALCNDIVFSYKQMCRSVLFQRRDRNSNNSSMNEIILLDD